MASRHNIQVYYLVSVLALWTPIATAGGYVIPLDEDSPPSQIDIRGLTADSYFYGFIAQQGGCAARVAVFFNDQTDYQYFVSTPIKDGSCWGYRLTGKNDPESRKIDAAGLLNVIPPLNKVRVSGGADPRICSLRLSWQIEPNGGGGMFGIATTSDCSARPQTAHCTLAFPPEITHPSQSTGDGRSEMKDTLRVYCNQNTSLHVSVDTTFLPLSADNGVINSRFFIGGHGQSSTVVFADTNTSVPMISVIDTTGASAGEYRGTIVLTVEWN